MKTVTVVSKRVASDPAVRWTAEVRMPVGLRTFGQRRFPIEQFMFPPESGCPRTVGCMRFEATIDVAAPAQLVFEVYIDIERGPEWTASVTRVERLDQDR